jgi:hypothetical protein
LLTGEPSLWRLIKANSQRITVKQTAQIVTTLGCVIALLTTLCGCAKSRYILYPPPHLEASQVTDSWVFLSEESYAFYTLTLSSDGGGALIRQDYTGDYVRFPVKSWSIKDTTIEVEVDSENGDGFTRITARVFNNSLKGRAVLADGRKQEITFWRLSYLKERLNKMDPSDCTKE